MSHSLAIYFIGFSGGRVVHSKLYSSMEEGRPHERPAARIDEIRDEMQRELERYQEAKASSPSLIAQKLSRQETQSA